MKGSTILQLYGNLIIKFDEKESLAHVDSRENSLLFSLFSVPHWAFAGPTGHETSFPNPAPLALSRRKRAIRASTRHARRRHAGGDLKV
jgi:hypothetical protein